MYLKKLNNTRSPPSKGWVAVPVIAIWNAIMMMTVLGGAKAIMVGPLVVGNVTPELFADMVSDVRDGVTFPNFSNEFQTVAACGPSQPLSPLPLPPM